MIQAFNKVTTTSNFIKNLLISTYLPLIRTVRDYDYIIADRLYIYKCNIIKCIKSGYIVTGIKNSAWNEEVASFRTIGEYYFGEKNGKLCTNYISNSEGYDSLTHERLGKYLRNLRDMYDLNLMPLYNCFSNEQFQQHHISSKGVEKTFTDFNTKLYKIPIRFNTDYTICMENLGITTFAPAFIKNNNLIKLNNTRFGNDVDATNKYIKLHRTDVVQNRANLRFKDPITLRFNNKPETKRVSYYEKSLREIDYLHSDTYYQLNSPVNIPRLKYYIKNDGYYCIAFDLTEEEFEKDVTNYYYNDGGIITQCTKDIAFDPNTVYFKLDSSKQGFTYLVTDLTPESAGDIPLYIGVEPSTGRIDSTYEAAKRYFWKDGRTVYTDIETYVVPDTTELHFNEEELDANYIPRTIEIEPQRIRIYDAPGFESVCLWNRCGQYHKYSEEEVYYVRRDGKFFVWEYFLSEEEYESG